MRNRMTLSFVLTLSLLLSLVSLPSPAQGQQPPGRFSASSGMITPGMGQGFRVTVVNTEGKDIRVRLGWKQYVATSCAGAPPVCRQSVVSQGATAMETLSPNEALSFDVPATGGGVNVTVSSNNPGARVLGVVFDHSTDRVMSICTFIPD